MIGFADDLLGREGRLLDALSRFGTEQLMRNMVEAVR
jgi:hypothetical protein